MTLVRPPVVRLCLLRPSLAGVEDELEASLAEQLTIPLTDRLDQVRSTLEQHLRNAPVDEGLELSGSVHDVGLQAVHITPEALVVRATVDASVEVEVAAVGP